MPTSGALSGVRIVVTRAAHQAEELAAPLSKLGAEVIRLPLIGIAPPTDSGPLQYAAERLHTYDWIVFTSANAVKAFSAELRDGAKSGQLRTRVAVVGPATQHAAEQLGFTVNLTPAEYVAESLLDAFGEVELRGCRILIPRAEVARDLVPNELRARGAQVDVVEAYRNVIPPDAELHVSQMLERPLPDWILFASSSAVHNLRKLCPEECVGELRLGSIGPVTSKTIRSYGWRVAAEAVPHTIEGLIAAVVSAHTEQSHAENKL